MSNDSPLSTKSRNVWKPCGSIASFQIFLALLSYSYQKYLPQEFRDCFRKGAAAAAAAARKAAAAKAYAAAPKREVATLSSGAVMGEMSLVLGIVIRVLCMILQGNTFYICVWECKRAFRLNEGPCNICSEWICVFYLISHSFHFFLAL